MGYPIQESLDKQLDPRRWKRCEEITWSFYIDPIGLSIHDNDHGMTEK